MKFFTLWQHPESRETSVFGPRHLITSFCYLNIVVSAVYLITNLRIHISPNINLIQIFGSIVTLIFLRLFSSHIPAAHIFMAMQLINASHLVLAFISFPYTILLWMPVFCIISVYLVGTGYGGIWSLVATITVSCLVFYGETLSKNPVPIAVEDLPAITVITLFLTSACAFMTSLFFARSIRDLVKIQEKQNSELKEQNTTIAAYAQDKALLVSIVVHDIATPLTLILHHSETAINTPDRAPTSLVKIRKAAQIIHEISKSVREFQSVESGKRTLMVEAVDLKKIFERAIFIFEERLNQKELSLEFKIPDHIELKVLAEEKSLSNSVINNLLSNAIKFSHPGQRIVISVDEDKDFVFLRVRDFGVGMSQNKSQSIFNKNISTSSKGTMGENGTVVGLPIDKS